MPSSLSCYPKSCYISCFLHCCSIYEWPVKVLYVSIWEFGTCPHFVFLASLSIHLVIFVYLPVYIHTLTEHWSGLDFIAAAFLVTLCDFRNKRIYDSTAETPLNARRASIHLTGPYNLADIRETHARLRLISKLAATSSYSVQDQSSPIVVWAYIGHLIHNHGETTVSSSSLAEPPLNSSLVLQRHHSFLSRVEDHWWCSSTFQWRPIR